MAHPAEINARFSQALWLLASNYEKISRDKVYSAIEAVLKRYSLGQDKITDQKEYKRLVTRAYKFLDDVIQVVNAEGATELKKETFAQKVKALIKKWLPL
jgi:hypothetical protein